MTNNTTPDLRAVLIDARDWFESQAKAVSKGCGSSYELHDLRTQRDALDEALASPAQAISAEPAVVRQSLQETFQGLGDRAYCNYIEQMQRDVCLGWEQKVKSQKFGIDELQAHAKAGEMLGRHRAFQEAANALRGQAPDATAAPAQAGEYPELPEAMFAKDVASFDPVYLPDDMHAYADAACAARGTAHADFMESVGLMLAAVGYTEQYARQWPKEKVSITFKRWFDEQLMAARGAAQAAPIEVTDEMALAFHHAISDSSIGQDDVDDTKTGLRAALANFTLCAQAATIDAAVQQDAERYRWLRGNASDDSERWSRWRIERYSGTSGWNPLTKDGLDSSVDAARAAQGVRHE